MTHIETADLKKLHERLIDSRDGYTKAAETVDTKQYQDLFQIRSRQRQEFAAKIGTELARRDEEFNVSGSITAAAHRFWTNIAAALDDSDKALAREVARGEEHLLDVYRDILDEAHVTDPLYAELNRQRAEIAKMVELSEDIAA